MKSESTANSTTEESAVEKVSSSSEQCEKNDDKTARRRKRYVKPSDKPRRPLSAYNLFFQRERALIISSPTPYNAADHQNQRSPVSVSSLGHNPYICGPNGLGGTSPYNVYFQDPYTIPMATPPAKKKKRVHRRTHGKIGFAELAKHIGQKWNSLDPQTKAYFQAQAELEKKRYKRELREYLERKTRDGDCDGDSPENEDEAGATSPNTALVTPEVVSSGPSFLASDSSWMPGLNASCPLPFLGANAAPITPQFEALQSTLPFASLAQTVQQEFCMPRDLPLYNAHVDMMNEDQGCFGGGGQESVPDKASSSSLQLDSDVADFLTTLFPNKNNSK